MAQEVKEEYPGSGDVYTSDGEEESSAYGASESEGPIESNTTNNTSDSDYTVNSDLISASLNYSAKTFDITRLRPNRNARTRAKTGHRSGRSNSESRSRSRSRARTTAQMQQYLSPIALIGTDDEQDIDINMESNMSLPRPKPKKKKKNKKKLSNVNKRKNKHKHRLNSRLNHNPNNNNNNNNNIPPLANSNPPDDQPVVVRRGRGRPVGSVSRNNRIAKPIDEQLAEIISVPRVERVYSPNDSGRGGSLSPPPGPRQAQREARRDPANRPIQGPANRPPLLPTGTHAWNSKAVSREVGDIRDRLRCWYLHNIEQKSGAEILRQASVSLNIYIYIYIYFPRYT